MSIKVIAAIDIKHGLSKEGDIPWNFKEDMKFFAKTTKGNVCILGRKTYEYIVEKTGKCLPGRDVIVVSKNKSFKPEYGNRCSSVKSALTFASIFINDIKDKDIFICGGAGIYEEGLPYANTVYLTSIPGNFHCDSFFPVNYIKSEFELSQIIPIGTGNVKVYEYTRR